MLWIATGLRTYSSWPAARARAFDSQLLSLLLAEFGFLSYDFAVHFRIPTSNHGPTVFVVVVVFEEAS